MTCVPYASNVRNDTFENFLGNGRGHFRIDVKHAVGWILANDPNLLANLESRFPNSASALCAERRFRAD